MTKSCYQKAVELLGPRPHFVQQLRQKLSARHYPDEEIEAAIERLSGMGVLDDYETARGLVKSRQRRSPIGRRRKLYGLPPGLTHQRLLGITQALQFEPE